MRRNILHTQLFGKRVQGRTLSGGLTQNRADRVHNLLAAAVADRNVHANTGQVRSLLNRPIQTLVQLARNQVNIADSAHRTAGGLHQTHQERINHSDQTGQLLLGALQVLSGEHVQAHLRNRQLSTPRKKINNSLRTGGVALTGAQAALSRPAAVTVHQHSNMCRQGFGAQRARQSLLIDGRLSDSAGVAGVAVHSNHGQGVGAHSSYLIRLSWQIIQRAHNERVQALILRRRAVPSRQSASRLG